MLDYCSVDYRLPLMAFPPLKKPNLRTGEGHGHFRPLCRKRPIKGAVKKKRKKRKLSAQSRKKNRMG